MYGHSHNNDTPSFSTNFLAVSESVTSTLLPPHAATTDYFIPPSPLAIPAYELNSVYATSSRTYDSPSYTASLTREVHRSGSSHSIATMFCNNGCFNQRVSSPSELLDSEGSGSNNIRRVFSTGDLQGTNLMHSHYHRSESSLSSESNNIIESMNKACPYSPEEKKERIERYRSKKTQRNFTKKIKYECRKTLADSRLRVRGRFARNDEIQTTEHRHTSQGGGEEAIDDEDVDDWMNNFLDSFPPILIP